MSAKTGYPCPKCGGAVRPTKASGLHRYGTMRFELPGSIAVPTCASCKEQYVTRELGRKIDAALEPLYRAALTTKAQNALDALASEARRYELELLLGLAQGYLSKVRSGDKAPSPRLVALLELLASDPRRIRELEGVWGMGPAREPAPGKQRRTG